MKKKKICLCEKFSSDIQVNKWCTFSTGWANKPDLFER